MRESFRKSSELRYLEIARTLWQGAVSTDCWSLQPPKESSFQSVRTLSLYIPLGDGGMSRPISIDLPPPQAGRGISTIWSNSEQPISRRAP